MSMCRARDSTVRILRPYGFLPPVGATGCRRELFAPEYPDAACRVRECRYLSVADGFVDFGKKRYGQVVLFQIENFLSFSGFFVSFGWAFVWILAR